MISYVTGKWFWCHNMNFNRIDIIPFPAASPLVNKGRIEPPKAKGVSRPGRIPFFPREATEAKPGAKR